jgi:hypothetical protein
VSGDTDSERMHDGDVQAGLIAALTWIAADR